MPNSRIGLMASGRRAQYDGTKRSAEAPVDFVLGSPESQGFPGQVRPPGVSRHLRRGRKA